MSDKPTGLSREEMEEFVDKLKRLHDSLNPRQQEILSYLITEARSSVENVRGFEGDGPLFRDRIRTPWYNEDMTWLATIQVPAPRPHDDRLDHFNRPEH